MKKVLIVMDYFVPSRKAGGAVKSVFNMVEALWKDFDFIIFTRDVDIDGAKYDNIESNIMNNNGKYSTIYQEHRRFTARSVFKFAAKNDIEIIYINSFFSPMTIRILFYYAVLRFIKMYKIRIAPRGEFSKGALEIKSIKKQTYIYLFRLFNMLKLVDAFHVSNNHEYKDLRKVFEKSRVILANDMPDKMPIDNFDVKYPRKHLVFLSRIVKKKNLHYLLAILNLIRDNVELDIYGPIEDTAYWKHCLKIIERLPPNIKVNYIGDLNPSDVPGVFAQYRAFIFPTLGENFGHVIIEAMSAGCIVIISDQTPWSDIENRKSGFVCKVDDDNSFVRSILKVIGMDDKEFVEYSERSRQYALDVVTNPSTVNQSRQIFE